MFVVRFLNGVVNIRMDVNRQHFNILRQANKFRKLAEQLARTARFREGVVPAYGVMEKQHGSF